MAGKRQLNSKELKEIKERLQKRGVFGGELDKLDFDDLEGQECIIEAVENYKEYVAVAISSEGGEQGFVFANKALIDILDIVDEYNATPVGLSFKVGKVVRFNDRKTGEKRQYREIELL